MKLGRRWLVPSLFLLAVPLIGADDSGCSTETVDKADSGGSGKPKKAVLGDALRLKGNDGAAKVTAVKIINPVSGGEFDKAEGGGHYVGVQFKIANTGKTTYKDAPSNGAKLVLTDDSRADSALLTGGPCGGSFATDVTIAPGEKRVGCIPFTVPAGGKVRTVQFSLDSGFGPQSGQWKVR